MISLEGVVARSMRFSRGVRTFPLAKSSDSLPLPNTSLEIARPEFGLRSRTAKERSGEEEGRGLFLFFLSNAPQRIFTPRSQSQHFFSYLVGQKTLRIRLTEYQY
ncbi:hypothetical protein NPIL_370971 [Nephila pilipes]|uniref:Uncharacterized protein n=1 Tax=Nephila pilipes TaxID=299642 RepID=A0A8X6UH32_NEPPI|nr:hypothetical protein NPIL_370971 [Nephila pilipes]